MTFDEDIARRLNDLEARMDTLRAEVAALRLETLRLAVREAFSWLRGRRLS